MCNHHDHNGNGVDRRSFIAAGVAGAALVTAAGVTGARAATDDPYADPASPALPPSDVTVTVERTALVVTDPQIDFLSPDGVTWGVVGKSVERHNTVANIGRLFAAAKQVGMTVAISPHYYYPTDHGWKFTGPLEKLMHKLGMFDRPSAYDMTDYDVDEVELIEAHGTATKAGDAAEFGGLQRAFEKHSSSRKQWCALGSVKSQIGHTKAAAGSASLFKVVMALHHKVLPPTIKVSEPNPALKIEDSPFYLNTETRPWIHDPKTMRKGSVSSFGFGGSNFHVALEEYQSGEVGGRYHNSPVELLLFSGSTAGNVIAAAESASKQLADCSLQQLAGPLQQEFDASSVYRLAIIAEDNESAITQIQQAAEKIRLEPDEAFSMPNRIHYGGCSAAGEPPKIGFLFPGQGSQYVNMGADLACEFDQAREAWDIASTVDLDSDYRLHQIVFPLPVFSDAARDEQTERLTLTQWAQPAIGCVSWSMLNLLKSLELEPDAVAGHSYGEVAALYAAGALKTPASLLDVSRRRGELMNEAASIPGAMTAVRAGRDEVQAYLDQWDCSVRIANINSPNQVVIAGETAEIEKAEQQLESVGATFRRLVVATAFHTDIVSPSAEPFHEFLMDIAVGKPSIPVYSNTTASRYETNPDSIRKMLAW